MLSFFPRGVLDEILNLIESVSEGFPSYSFIVVSLFKTAKNQKQRPFDPATESYPAPSQPIKIDIDTAFSAPENWLHCKTNSIKLYFTSYAQRRYRR